MTYDEIAVGLRRHHDYANIGEADRKLMLAAADAIALRGTDAALAEALPAIRTVNSLISLLANPKQAQKEAGELKSLIEQAQTERAAAEHAVANLQAERAAIEPELKAAKAAHERSLADAQDAFDRRVADFQKQLSHRQAAVDALKRPRRRRTPPWL